MNSIIRSSSDIKILKKTNIKLLITAILNLIDGIFSYIGVTNNYVVEVNILMVNIISDFNKLIIIKLLIPSIAFLFIYYLINRFVCNKMTIAHMIINLCFIVYIFVFMTHLAWISVVAFNRLF